MPAVKAALQLYAVCGRKTLGALFASAPALLALVVYGVVLVALHQLLGRFGFAGGLAIGLAHAACAGSYLFLVEELVRGSGRLNFTDVTDSVGPYLWDVISVLFLFWIAQLLLGALGLPGLSAVLVLAAFVAFNPVPEVIYQSRSRSMEALGRSAGFIREAWPEWFAPQIVLLFLVAPLLHGGDMLLFRMFGPFFGFLDVGRPLAQAFFGGFAHGGMLVWTATSVVLVHTMMLFRGFLYRELSCGSRRTRAWKARQ